MLSWRATSQRTWRLNGSGQLSWRQHCSRRASRLPKWSSRLQAALRS